MKLNNILNQLKKLEFIDDFSAVNIVVCDRDPWSPNKIFSTRLTVSDAEKFFGDFDVHRNEVGRTDITNLNCSIPTFVFHLLSPYEK